MTFVMPDSPMHTSALVSMTRQACHGSFDDTSCGDQGVSEADGGGAGEARTFGPSATPRARERRAGGSAGSCLPDRTARVGRFAAGG